MKKNLALLLLGFIFVQMCAEVSLTNLADELSVSGLEASDVENETESQDADAHLLSIRFEDESLIDVIQYIASEKGANVILPIEGNEIKSKVTIQLPEKLTVEAAWNFLGTLIELAGYAIFPLPDDSYVIKKGVKASQEALPIFIGTWDSLDAQIPDTDEYVRALIYLRNIKLSDDTSSDFTKLLTDLLPKEAGVPGGLAGEGKKFVLDTLSNALIIAERGRVIKSVMRIVSSLERTGFRENYEVIPLFHATADDVARLFNDSILEPGQTQRFMPGAPRPQSEATYFSRYLHIIPESRLNALIVLGKDQAIDRLRTFIRTYIDIEPDRGESILHVIKLQYLDAFEFAQVLQKILTMEGAGAADQSRGQASAERYFEGPPIVIADTPETTGVQAEGEAVTPQYYGGNKLIIVARHNDWIRIEELTQKLDKPKAQVIIEVLVADLTIDDNRLLGGMLRNPLKTPLPGDMQFQSGQLGRVYVNDLKNPQTVSLYPPDCSKNTDIMQQSFTEAGGLAQTDLGAVKRYADLVPEGTAMIGFDDENKKTWGMLQVRQQFVDRKVISYPHVIATNNETATIVIGEEQLLPDETTSSSGGATNIQYKWIKANLEISITPRISSAPNGEDLVQLGIHVKVDDFNPLTTGDRFTREVKTSALLGSGDVLPLGGLLRSSSETSTRRTPILGQIPIIGYFFKNRNSAALKTNLTVFLCPTVIQPRFRAGAGLYTRDYVKLSKKYIEEGGLFASLQDPINRWFFNPDLDPEKEMDDFIAQDEFKRNLEDEPLSVDEDFTGERKILEPGILEENSFITDLDKEKALKDIMAQLDIPALDEN